jgi:two-component system, chemotaxis family, sensor kinase CheA
MSEQATETGGEGPVFDNEMAEILESFLIETREIFERLGQDLLTLEKGVVDNELLNTIFRAVHTVKGTSSFLGLEQMTALAHVFEDVLNKLRKGEITVSSDKMDVMFEAYDIMKDLLARIEARNLAKIDLTAIIAKLRVIGSVGMAAPDVPAVKAPAALEPAPPEDAADLSVDAVTPDAPEPAPAPVAQPAKAQAPAAAAVAQHPDATQAAAKTVDSTIRVDVARLDSLMNLVGELVLGRNRLTQISYLMNQEHEGIPITKDLTETSSQIDFITTELQMAVMKTRMVPIAKVFNKLPRLVRDLMKETGKDMDLVVFGEDTELDKSIIEELNDPLVHLMRNAGDHGLESTADRRAAGKPERGTITVRAEHEGNHIVISVADDGKGMDPEKLKAKAIERGMITEAQAREMSKTEAFNLVFAPGFSTAAKVTNVSGRGVGMDVVRTNIQKLKGIIEIESDIGKGSKIIIKLPLTLAIIQALLVEVDREVFSVPLESVLEVVRIQPKEINTISGREVVRLRNTVLPLARLHAIMGTLGADEKQDDWIYIVVVGLAQQRLGIVVDSLLGQKEVVIKSLGGYLGTVPGIAGSTILGDGRVIMIIDVGELMKLYSELR